MLFSFLISYTYKNKTYLRLVNHTVSQLESQVVEKKFNLFNYVPTTHRDLYATAFNMFDNNKFFGSGYDKYADGFYPISELKNQKG